MSIHGRDWIYHIPRKRKGRVSNNTSEYIAEIIKIWVDISEEIIQREDCALHLSENSKATVWTFKSNFDESKQ